MLYQPHIDRYLRKHGFEALCPKAVLFDMDGVLYDSMPNHAEAWQRSMEKFGISMTRDDAYATEGQRGVDTIRQMVKLQKGCDINEEEAQVMYDEKSRLFHEMPEAPVMPGSRELMAKIQASGMAIGVVTGSGQRPLLNRLINDFKGFLDRDHIVNAYDIKRGKPHPAPYLKGLEKCGGLQPWQAIVVENAPLGVEAGVAANIFTICINTGHLPEVILKDKGADILLESMSALNMLWEELPFNKSS